ncbi:IS1 family transposase [Sulfurisphaera ohwakuensis]|uniref:IS1 family transposase n=1 Tax=Sulfurisphaera ohwakuensis TaxID=69656 RepID=A0A7J9RTA3_SULOH|nr:IS1 family transposase [Sulfurisphaera ohwakuensis]
MESYNSYYRANLIRLATDNKAVNRNERLVKYSLALLNVI